MNYREEFRVYWPNLLGAGVGIGVGSAIYSYTSNIFAPALIAEFGWTKAELAVTGSLALISLFFIPVAGRFVDKVGPRKAAIVGFTIVPLCFLAFSLMTGNIYQYYAITLVKTLFGVLTTTLVFCRTIVERFDKARGMALSMMMSGAPLIGAIAVPLIGLVVDAEGWRAGYRLLALVCALGGIFAISLIGRSAKEGTEEFQVTAQGQPITRAEFFGLARRPIFFLLVGGMFLCNFPQIIVNSQLKLVLYESHAASGFATMMVSVYAIAVVIGRFVCGYTLDRVPPNVVALFSLGLPAVGYLILASSLDVSWALMGSVGLIGLAQGAEGDIGALLTSRKFEMRHYSFVFGFVMAGSAAASAIGALTLGYTLRETGSFNTFLVISAIMTVLGALSFFMTGRVGRNVPPASSEDANTQRAEAAELSDILTT